MSLSLQEVESFRSYLDNLFSEDDSECFDATTKIKNLIIGSNRQKRFIIEQGFVPRLIVLLQDESKPLNLKLNVAIIIGSLAKGTESNVQDLDKFGTEEVLLNLTLSPTTDPKMVEICLSVLKTIMQYPSKIRNSFFQHSEDINTLSRLISKLFFALIYCHFLHSDSCRTCITRHFNQLPIFRGEHFTVVLRIFTRQRTKSEHELVPGWWNSVFSSTHSERILGTSASVVEMSRGDVLH